MSGPEESGAGPGGNAAAQGQLFALSPGRGGSGPEGTTPTEFPLSWSTNTGAPVSPPCPCCRHHQLKLAPFFPRSAPAAIATVVTENKGGASGGSLVSAATMFTNEPCKEVAAWRGSQFYLVPGSKANEKK